MTGRLRSSCAAASRLSSLSGMLIAPGRCSCSYRAAGGPRRAEPPARAGVALRPGRSASASARWSERGDGPPAVHLVDHVDGLVLAVGAGYAKQHGQPANRSEASLLGERATKDELVAEAVEVTARLLA